MKKIIFLFKVAILLLAFQSGFAQAPDWTRVLQLNTFGSQTANVVTADVDHGYMAGSISGPVTYDGVNLTSVGANDLLICKVGNDGVTAWIKQLNAQAEGTITPNAIEVDGGGNVYLSCSFKGTVMVGSSTVTSDATRNSFVAKFDASGNGIWATPFLSTGTWSSKMAVDPTGCCYLISGSSKLLKYSNAGILQWEQAYPNGTLQAIAIDGSNLYLGGALRVMSTLFGSFNLISIDSYNTAFLAKANFDGVYSKTLVEGGPFLSTKDGAYWTVGTFVHPTDGPREIRQTKTLLGFEENVLSTTVGDLGSGSLVLTINPDNTVTVSGSVGSEPIVQSGVNIFDPVKKIITVNYSYTGTEGDMVISEVYTKSKYPNGDGSAVSDIEFDNGGNMIITGGCAENYLTFNNLSVINPVSNTTFIAKCTSDFDFAWIKPSSSFSNPYREMMGYRLFTDNLNNIYEYGLISTSFTFGSVSVEPNGGQFLVKFDADGNATASYALQNTSAGKIMVNKSGMLVNTGFGGDFGNIYFKQQSLGNLTSPIWEKVSSGSTSGEAFVSSVKYDAMGNIYLNTAIRGYSNYFGTAISADSPQTVISKLDNTGGLLWKYQINNSIAFSQSNFGPRFTLDKEGNALMVGLFETSVSFGVNTFTNAESSNDGYVAKLTAAGDLAWAIQLSTQGDGLEINGIVSDAEGNVIVSGMFRSQLTVLGNTVVPGNNNLGAFILKFDKYGNYLWANGYPGDVVYSAMVSVDGSNNIYLAAEMYDYSTNMLTFGSLSVPQGIGEGGTVLVKFDPNGTPQWAKTYGGVAGKSPNNWAVDIKNDAAGNSYLWGWCQNNAVFGTFTLTNPIGTDFSFYLTKINTNGEVVWANAVYEKQYAFNYGDLLDLDKAGNVYVGGHFKDVISIEGTTYQPEGSNDFFVSKYSNTGTHEWIKIIPANANVSYGLSVFDEDVLIVAGNSGKNSMLGNFPITRMGGSSCIVATLGNLPFLTLSENALTAAAADNSTATFDITSNIIWTASSDQGWLTASSGTGSGNATLTLTATANPTTSTRIAVITVSGVGVTSQTVTVTQTGASTGISDLVEGKCFFYPNPATRVLYFSVELKAALVSIYDLSGKLVLSKSVTDSKIDISALQNGLYTIKVERESGVIVEKFLKQ